MRIINASVHGIIDYLVALSLVVAPFFVDLSGGGAIGRYLSVAAGVGLFAYSMLTGYSLGLRRLIPFWLHLVFDFAAGLAFIAAPLLFGFEGLAQIYYLGMGMAIVAVVLLTAPRVEVPAESR